MSYLQQPKNPSAENQPAGPSVDNKPSILSSVTGPLSAKYCNLLFVITWISFIGILIFIAGGLYTLLSGGAFKNRPSPLQIALGIYQFGLLILVYILYRIFYNMCLHSL